MSIKVWFIRNEVKTKLSQSDLGEDSVAPGGSCPECGKKDYRVAGTGKRFSADDRAYEADAICSSCNAYVGLIRAEPDTLFGVREDAAVLNGRCRVY